MNWSSTVRKKYKLRMFKEQNGKCHWCGEEMTLVRTSDPPRHATFDHLIPRSRGGTDSLKNIRLSCRICNERRGSCYGRGWVTTMAVPSDHHS